jgi:hypothetical protein
MKETRSVKCLQEARTACHLDVQRSLSRVCVQHWSKSRILCVSNVGWLIHYKRCLAVNENSVSCVLRERRLRYVRFLGNLDMEQWHTVGVHETFGSTSTVVSLELPANLCQCDCVLSPLQLCANGFHVDSRNYIHVYTKSASKMCS